MKSQKLFSLGLLGGALVSFNSVAAGEPQDSDCDSDHDVPHYRLLDMGTFGGPNSQYSTPSSRVINNHGLSTGIADTAVKDPDCFFDCLVDLAFIRDRGVTRPLPSLTSGYSSFPQGISESGIVVGQSQNGIVDPLTGVSQLHGALWARGRVIDLSTLGGNASNAFAVNSRGEVAGAAANGTLDPFADAVMSSCRRVPTSVCPGATFAFSAMFTSSTTETHAFIWRHGNLHDLGTLGGPDSVAVQINERGDATGWSYTSYIADPSTGVPVVNAFFWDAERQTMIDMGNLGGTFEAPYFMNNRGEVTGTANLPGDQAFHPFVWSKRRGMVDIGTLGGATGHPDWINNAGDVVGVSRTSDGLQRAFLWRGGKMRNLGTIGTAKDSEATSINSRGQVVGLSGIFGVADQHGWLWERSGPLVDLNTLVVAGDKLSVIAAIDINDRGEIAGVGALSNGDTHAIVLIPCDDTHPGIDACNERRMQSPK